MILIKGKLVTLFWFTNLQHTISIIPKFQKGTHKNLKNLMKSHSSRIGKKVDHVGWMELRTQRTITLIPKDEKILWEFKSLFNYMQKLPPFILRPSSPFYAHSKDSSSWSKKPIVKNFFFVRFVWSIPFIWGINHCCANYISVNIWEKPFPLVENSTFSTISQHQLDRNRPNSIRSKLLWLPFREKKPFAIWIWFARVMPYTDGQIFYCWFVI